MKDLILRFDCKSVFDPAEDGGTVRDVVEGVNQHLRQSIRYEGRDLRDGWNVLDSQLPEQEFDLVWYHPPYWDIIRYSRDEMDLSSCQTLEEFETKLNRSAERLLEAVRPGGILAVLIGDKRKSGGYYPLMRTLLMNPRLGKLRALIVKVQHNCRSDGRAYGVRNPFLIPIRHEYCLIFEKVGLPIQ